MRTGFAQRSFTYSAPHIWNTLPSDIICNLNVAPNILEEDAENVLLHQVVFIVSRASRACDFVIYNNNKSAVKL